MKVGDVVTVIYHRNGAQCLLRGTVEVISPIDGEILVDNTYIRYSEIELIEHNKT